MKRSEVESKYMWNLSHMVDGDGEWERLFAELAGGLAPIAGFRGRLGQRDELLACLKMRDGLSLKLEKLYGYASMKADEDTKNDAYKGMKDRIYALYVQFMTIASYIAPELTALPDETLRGFIADAGFGEYDYMLTCAKNVACSNNISRALGDTRTEYLRSSNIDCPFFYLVQHCVFNN